MVPTVTGVPAVPATQFLPDAAWVTVPVSVTSVPAITGLGLTLLLDAVQVELAWALADPASIAQIKKLAATWAVRQSKINLNLETLDILFPAIRCAV
jgi:hypothetical protein